MRELSVPSIASESEQRNAADYVFANVQPPEPRGAAPADRFRLDRRHGREFGTQVMELAKGLVASGIAAGDRVGLMSKTRYEWTIADLALLTIGAVMVPIYETSSADQVEWILADSGARASSSRPPRTRSSTRCAHAARPEPGLAVRVRRHRHVDRAGGTSVTTTSTRRRAADQPGRSRVDHLHLRYDRSAQGLRADAGELHQRGRRAAGRARRLLQ